jgi:glycosyltransferase involved in cell wall biosynthesis
MKLLIVTQAVDIENPVLGFFVQWIEELANHFEHIEVICLFEGKHELPKNVRVNSLGKERGTPRIARAWRVLRYSYARRKHYDAVFVHMNEEYVLLAGWLWRLLGKKIYLWRNHYTGTWRTDRAVAQCDKVFCTSKYSYTAKFSKTVLMPVGVDTALYTRMPEVARDPKSILFYARMAPSKNPGLLLDALGMLHNKGVNFSADFYGTPLPQDEAFASSLVQKAKELGLDGLVRFLPGRSHRDGPGIFNTHAIFVNASRSGMYDKTLLEAAACECMVVAASKDFAELVPERVIFEEGNAADLAATLEPLLQLAPLEQQSLGFQMHAVANTQSLEILGKMLTREITA